MEKNQIKCIIKVNRIRYYKDNWGILSVSLIQSEYGDIKTDKNNCFIIKRNMIELIIKIHL